MRLALRKSGQDTGHALIVCLVTISLLGLSAGKLAVERVQHLRAVDQRLTRLQGREWALAALLLPSGTSHQEDTWTLQHHPNPLSPADAGDILASAQSPRGLYVITTTGERWLPTRRKSP